MIPYDKTFWPPAIMAPVALTGVVKTRPKVTVQAMIDTGADITAIPVSLEETLKLYRFSRLQLEDVRGFRESVYTYEVRLGLAGQKLAVMEVILAPFPFVVLGRDWLETRYLLLNGPEQQFLLSEKPLVKMR
ncbi:MAG: retroviral-like aspartic protease [Chloroflexi bacterium]|jgi:predicted aspartyl protease|nr:retroviral-like aspartic protease [Chloroflexota bacterium]